MRESRQTVNCKTSSVNLPLRFHSQFGYLAIHLNSRDHKITQAKAIVHVRLVELWHSIRDRTSLITDTVSLFGGISTAVKFVHNLVSVVLLFINKALYLYHRFRHKSKISANPAGAQEFTRVHCCFLSNGPSNDTMLASCSVSLR